MDEARRRVAVPRGGDPRREALEGHRVLGGDAKPRAVPPALAEGSSTRIEERGHWGPEEDDLLHRLVGVNHDLDKWGEVASQISGRTAKQCRERWRHHLDPCVKKSG